MTIISSSELSSYTDTYLDLAEKEHVFVESKGKYFRLTMHNRSPVRSAVKSPYQKRTRPSDNIQPQPPEKSDTSPSQ
jgi:hypothetical protein